MTLKKYIYSNIEIIGLVLLVSILVYLVYLLSRHSLEGFFTEQKGINQLDAIIYINLEDRNDRKE